MRLVFFALLLFGLAVALMVVLRRPPPPSSARTLSRDEPALRPPSSPSPPSVPSGNPTPLAAGGPPTVPAPSAMNAPSPTSAPAVNDAAVSEWHARHEERDYAYWDMKLNMLRKIEACVGDQLHTEGAAEVNYHFKVKDGVWLADRAEVRDPSDGEREKMGAVEFRGGDRELAQRCISEAFAGVTMPMTGGTDQYEEYEVHGQIMFPTRADKAWKQTGVNP